MKKISAFDHSIYKFSILEDDISIPEEWADYALHELSKPEVKLNQQYCNPDKGTVDGGMLWSTFGAPARSFFDHSGTEKLLEWIKDKVILAAPNLGFKCTSIDLTIDWMNIMYKGSFGNCHTHEDYTEPDTKKKIVAIFYLQAPENSSKLLVVKNNKDYSKNILSPYDIPQEEIFPINVTTGDLIVHKVDLPHGMSTHLNDIPRLVVVMEFRYNEK